MMYERTNEWIEHFMEQAGRKMSKQDLMLTAARAKWDTSSCSTVIVDERSVITYDKGIALPCEQAGMEVLLISPGHVLLPGFRQEILR